MSFFQDLTPYQYLGSHEVGDPLATNVGWLSAQQPFEKGPTSQAFRERLLTLCRDSNVVQIARGFQVCDLCAVTAEEWWRVSRDRFGRDSHWMSIGDGEIRVFAGRTIFAAPALIYHYVVDHDYRPPDAFIEAVLSGPAGDSEEYCQMLSRWRKERQPNQALQTTSVTRSGFGKIPASDRQRRGV